MSEICVSGPSVVIECNGCKAEIEVYGVEVTPLFGGYNYEWAIDLDHELIGEDWTTQERAGEEDRHLCGICSDKEADDD